MTCDFDGFSFQYPTKINIFDVIDLSPSTFELICLIPEIIGKCGAAELFIEKHLTQQELELLEQAEASPWSGINNFLGVDVPKTPYATVPEIKEKMIKEAVIQLCEKINAFYSHQLQQMKIDLQNVKQIVEIPISYLDLYPGDTEMHFRVFTKRELRHKNDL